MPGAAGISIAPIISSFLTNLFVKAAISIGVSALTSALSKPKQLPQAQNFTRQLQDRTLTLRQPIAPRRIIYGSVRVGGIYTFIHTTGSSNQTLNLVVTISGHEIEAIDTLYFDGVEVPLDGSGDATGDFAGLVHMEKNLGTDSQSAFAGLVAEAPSEWTVFHRQRGCAGVYLKLTYSADKFPNGIPALTFAVRGKNDIFDPRTSINGYETNTALCVADYISQTKFGLGAVYSTEILDADLIEAANICDESVSLLAGGSENRYECHGTLDTDQTPYENIKALTGAFAGVVITQGKLWIVRAGAYRAPEITALTESDFVGPIDTQTLITRQKGFNGVKGVFTSPLNSWQPDDFPAVQVAAYVAEDNDEEVWAEITLGFTTSVTMAQRIARLMLELQRRQKTISVPCRTRAYQLQPFDTVPVTIDRYGWTDKTFQVKKMGVDIGPSWRVLLTLQEIDSSAYSWSTSDESDYATAPGTNMPDAAALDPTAITVVENPYSLEGSVTVGWTAALSIYTQTYQVEYLPEDAASWIIVAGQTSDTNKVVTPLVAGNYYFRVKSISVDGSSSDYLVSTLFTVVVPSVMPRVSGLELRGELANSDEFTGKDAKFVWREASQVLSYDVGAEPYGGDSGARDRYFKDFEIRVFDETDVKLRTEHTLDPFYDYTFEKNAEDNAGTPQRTFSIEVYQRGDQAQISAIPARITVSNPAPGQLTSLSVRASFKYVFVEWVPDDDLDFDGVQIFMDTTSGFTPGAANLVAETASQLIGIDALPETQYYVKVAAFDAFGKEGIVYSTEIPILTAQIDTPDIKVGAITADLLTVAQLSAITADMGTVTAGIVRDTNSFFVIDMDNVLTTITDDQTTPVARVKIGKLGVADTDYGIEIYDSSGNAIITADGLGLDVVGTANIEDLAVDTIKIKDNSVIIGADATTAAVEPAGTAISSVKATPTVMQTVTYTSTGATVQLYWSIEFIKQSIETGPCDLYIRFKKNGSFFGPTIVESRITAHLLTGTANDGIYNTGWLLDAPAAGSVTYEMNVYRVEVGTTCTPRGRNRSLLAQEALK